MILKRKRRLLKWTNINNLQSVIFSVLFVLIFICDLSSQKRIFSEDNININNNNNNNNNSNVNNNTNSWNYFNNKNNNSQETNDGVETEFIDAKSNRYETANYNFCPFPCSCLGDYFECKKVNFTKVPKLPGWVRRLELTGNKLDDDVENQIENLTELIALNLKKNRLHRIPVFKGLIALQKLNLAHNKIQIITVEALLSLPNLHELDLSKNIIKTILPNSFPSKNNLNLINLNYNRITSLEDSVFDSLTKLTDLYLNHNNLTTLSNGIFKSLSTLKKMDLSHNRLEFTWFTFKGLNELKVLKLRSNNIRNLPDGVFHALKSINILELDSNQITHLSRQGFYNLTSLQILSLSNNSVSSIETDTWEFTQNLVTIDLSYNNLTELRSQHLQYLKFLKILNLNHNKIRHIADNTFELTKSLEQLDLSFNKISWTIEDTCGFFKALKNLQKLDLSNNNIKSINQKAFDGLENLKNLNLDFNNITSMQVNAFESLKKLEKLSLTTNHFICDCNIQWLNNWLKTNIQITKQIQIFCDYPVHLRGKKLQILKEEDFMCNESPKPVLIKEPTNQLAIKGTNIVLECIATSTSSSEMYIQWKRENSDIPGSDIKTKLIKEDNNSTTLSSSLHLQNVNHDHTGKYQCIVTNSFGTSYSQKFKITVATYPGFYKVPSNVTLNAGNTARLDCSAYGEPPPQIAWQKDGGDDFPAARERRMHVMMPTDDAFFIVNAKTSDMGVYTCTAENPAGIIKANATLTVHESPAFVKPMESKEVSQGTSTVLECMSSGSPKPTLNWYKDNKPLKITERHFFAAESQLLIIVNTKLSDAGNYRCEMKNDLGSISGNVTLTINQAATNNVVNVEEMTGIVIITVFCCAVGTSVIWVVIIYQTKRGNNAINSNNCRNNNSNYLNSNGSSNNNNNTNLNSVPLLNQVISTNTIDSNNYIQTSTAVNISDEVMQHFLNENSGSSQSSQVIIMNHLNNVGDLKNDLLYRTSTITVAPVDTIDNLPVTESTNSERKKLLTSSTIANTNSDTISTAKITINPVTLNSNNTSNCCNNSINSICSCSNSSNSSSSGSSSSNCYCSNSKNPNHCNNDDNDSDENDIQTSLACINDKIEENIEYSNENKIVGYTNSSSRKLLTGSNNYLPLNTSDNNENKLTILNHEKPNGVLNYNANSSNDTIITNIHNHNNHHNHQNNSENQIQDQSSLNLLKNSNANNLTNNSISILNENT